MPLPSFNLAKTITDYNTERRCNYAPDEDFGFAYFEKDLLTKTRAAIILVNTGLDRYHLTPEERAYLKKRNQYYQQYLRDGIEAPIRALEEDNRIAWDVRQKMQYWNWMNKWVTHLSQPETWQAWLNTIPHRDKSRLLELKQQWEKMAPFVCHTHTSLHAVTTDLLPTLIEHHRAARRQLIWSFWELPRDIWIAYKKYLDNFLQEAEKTKAALAATLLLRLQCFDKNRLNEGHLLMDLHQELQKMGVIPKSETIPLLPEPLTTEQFHDFHRYIEQHGDEPTKQELKKLSWMSENSTCSTHYVLTSSSAFLIPEEFVKAIPLALRKPAWLHRGHNLRHTFFKNKGLLFASLKTYPDISQLSLSLQDLSAVSPVLTDLNHKYYEIEKALNELQDPAYQALGWFQKYTQRFIQHWQTYLVNYHYKIIESKLQIAERIVTQLQLSDPVDAMLHAWSACSFINKFIKILQSELKVYPQEGLQERLVTLETQLVSILSNYRVLQLIQKVASGKVISQEKLNYVLEVTQTICLADKKMYAHFQELCQPHFLKMRQVLDDELKTNPCELNNPKMHADRILQLNKVLEACSDEVTRQINQQRIAEKLPKYFLKYLETLLRCGQGGENFANSENAILAFEQVLLALDTGCLFASKTLGAHAKDLQQLREDAFNRQGSWSLVYARCQGLVQLLLADYFEKRNKKDLATFDHQLFDFIKRDADLPFNENTIRVLQNLSDQHIEQLNATLEDLARAPEQRTIAGLNGGSCAYILELLTLRRYVHLQQQQILAEPLSLKEKSKRMKTLAADLREGLQKNPKPSVYASMGFTASGRRGLFTKSYLDTQLLSTEDKSTPPESRLLLTK